MDEKELIPVSLHPMTDRVTRDRLLLYSDQPGVGGGCHRYVAHDAQTGELLLDLRFQHGPLNEAPLNGVVTGTVIQILIHHLKGFASGPYPSRETSLAITELEQALAWTKQRELEREQRGVLGVAAK